MLCWEKSSTFCAQSIDIDPLTSGARLSIVPPRLQRRWVRFLRSPFSQLPSVELGMPVASDNSCNDILFSATLKSFSRSGMVSLVCIVHSLFKRYRQITMILVKNKVNFNSCLVQNIGKNQKEDIFSASWIYRIRIKILRKQFHTMNRKGVQKLWNVVNVSV